MTRWRAASIHLGLSLSIFVLFLAQTFLVWYPVPYFSAMGIWGLLGLLAGVDVLLGPALTLLVFKSGKKSLAFDLTVITMVQLAALGYGGWTVMMARPVFVVFDGNKFAVTTALYANKNPAAAPAFRQPSLFGPVFGYTKYAEKDLFHYILKAGVGDRQAAIIADYQPFEGNESKVVAAAKPLAAFASQAAGKTPQFRAYLAAHPTEQRLAVNISWRDQDGIALLNAKTALPETIVLLQ